MRPDKPQTPAEIGPIIDLALLYNPSLAMADLSTPRMWINEGCSIDNDILPVLKECMKRKKGVSRFHYWTNPVLEARDKRQLAAKQQAAVQAKPEEYYMEIYRWKRERGMALTTEQEKQLDEYERKRNPRAVEAAGGRVGL